MVNTEAPTTELEISQVRGVVLIELLAVVTRGIHMKIKTRLFTAYTMTGGGWFRVFGAVISWKDTTRIRLSFSERNGYKRHWMIGRWSFAVLWPSNG